MRAIYSILEVLAGIPGLGFLGGISSSLMQKEGAVQTRVSAVKLQARRLDGVRKNAAGLSKKKTKKGVAETADPSESRADVPTSTGTGSGSEGYGASRGPTASADGDYSPAPKAIPGVHVSRRKNLREERERDREMRRRRS